MDEISKTETVKRIAESSLNLEMDKIIKEAISLGIAESTILSAVRQSVSTLLREKGVRNPTIFFSYSHKDKDFVRAIADGLRDEGIDVWIDEHRIKVGDSIIESLLKGWYSADFLAYFISENSINSRMARIEIDTIISRRLHEDKGAIIIPILLEAVEVPSLLRDALYLDARDKNISKAVNQILKTIKYHLDKRT